MRLSLWVVVISFCGVLAVVASWYAVVAHSTVDLLQAQLLETRKLSCGDRARMCGPGSTGNELRPLLETRRVQLPGDAVLESPWQSVGGWTRRFLHVVTVLTRIAASAPDEQSWYVIDIETRDQLGDLVSHVHR